MGRSVIDPENIRMGENAILSAVDSYFRHNNRGLTVQELSRQLNMGQNDVRLYINNLQKQSLVRTERTRSSGLTVYPEALDIY